MPTPPHKHGTVHSGVGYRRPRVVPRRRPISTARPRSSTPASASRCSSGRARCTRPTRSPRSPSTLGAGVAKALLGKAVLPDDLPYVTGSIGLLGTKPSWDMMKDCDTLLMVGSSFPYSEFLPEEGQARGVQIDIDGRMLGIRYPMEVNLVGDSAETLRALMPRLTRKEDRSWREQIEGGVAEWWKLMERARASRPTRSTRSSCSGSCPSACPTARSSARTPARRRTGTRATSSCAEG